MPRSIPITRSWRLVALTMSMSVATVGAACGSTRAPDPSPTASASDAEPAPSASVAVAPSASDAPSAGAPVKSIEPQANDTRPLREQLAKDVGGGGDVAIAASVADGGLWAYSLDGTKRRRLLVEDVRWVMVDPIGDVIWYWPTREKASELKVIDLQATTVEPASIITVPVVDSTALGWFAIQHSVGLVHPPPVGPVSTGDGYGLKLRLDASPPRFEYVFVPIDANTKEGKRTVTEPAIPADVTARLVAIAKRSAGKKATPAPTTKRLKTTKIEGCTVDPNLKPKRGETLMMEIWCGDTEAIEGTSLQRVVVGAMSGAGTFATWVFYDPTGVVKQELPGFSQAVVARSGKAAFASGVLLDPSTQKVVIEGADGDFLDGGLWLPALVNPTPELR